MGQPLLSLLSIAPAYFFIDRKIPLAVLTRKRHRIDNV
jgi:hypothetical protein